MGRSKQEQRFDDVSNLIIYKTLHIITHLNSNCHSFKIILLLNWFTHYFLVLDFYYIQNMYCNE